MSIQRQVRDAPVGAEVNLSTLPHECILRILAFVQRNDVTGRDALQFSQTCQTLRTAADEEFWRGICFLWRKGLVEDTWKQTVLSLMRYSKKAGVAVIAAPLPIVSKRTVTCPLPASKVIADKVRLMPKSALIYAAIEWDSPPCYGTLHGGSHETPRRAADNMVIRHHFATEPPCKGLVVRFDEYIPELPGLEHLLVANDSGITIANVLDGIYEWMQVPLTAAQKANLYAHYAKSTLEAEVVDLLAEATQGPGDPIAPSSNTLRRAQREAFMFEHKTRADLATLPFGGWAPIKPGTVYLTVKWATHQRGDEWMTATEAPVFNADGPPVLYAYRAWNDEIDGKASPQDDPDEWWCNDEL